ncbi:MAG: SDR family oxidoreductase [Halobacteriales archaeon]
MSETVVITGCSSGIGRATARAFSEEGWIVYATARDTDDVDELIDVGCQVASLDVTDEEQIETVIERVLNETGRIDCLINNAGIASVGALEELSTATLHEQFDTNLYGPHRLIRAVVPHMRNRKAGRIINVGSVAARFPVPIGGAYAATKAALAAYTASLRDELRSFDVEVILIEPPFVDTAMSHKEVAAATNRIDSVYASMYRKYERFARNELSTALQPADVAETIITAATSAHPQDCYRVSMKGQIQAILGLLSARLRYWLWSRFAAR